MDELTRRLRRDAERIDGAISSTQEHRLEAALADIAPRTRLSPQAERPRFFLATLMGLSAAAAMILLALSFEPAPAVSDLPSKAYATPMATTTWPEKLGRNTMALTTASEQMMSLLTEESKNLETDFLRIQTRLRKHLSF